MPPIVTVTWASHGLAVGRWLSVVVPVAIGGIVVRGYYQVASVPSTSTFTLVHSSAAASTDSSPAVPVLSTVAGDATVTVALEAHGYLPGESYNIAVSTSVGGLVLQGTYVVASVPTADTLTIEAPYAAGATASVSENGGDMRLAAQAANLVPVDTPLTPMSRTEYSMLGSKTMVGTPSSFFLDRQSPSPVVYIWPLPSGSAPQELQYWRMRRMQDANPQGAETLDVPYRFIEPFTAELAAHLAGKWATDEVQRLQADAVSAWKEASNEDRERVNLDIKPSLGGYHT